MTNAHFIIRVGDRIDRFNTAIGRTASWCALAIVLIGFAVVLLRYVLGIGSIWLQELILYAHAALFLLAAAWTLKEGGHVRVDVFYADAVAAHQGVDRSARRPVPAAAVLRRDL